MFGFNLGRNKNTIASSFQSVSKGYVENALSVDRLLIDHPASTFFFKYGGINIPQEGLFNGDILVVDRSILSIGKGLYLVIFEGRIILRKIILEKNSRTGVTKLVLRSPDSSNKPGVFSDKKDIVIDKDKTFEVWGKITGIARKMK